jgi:hypothetical protein
MKLSHLNLVSSDIDTKISNQLLGKIVRRKRVLERLEEGHNKVDNP